MSLFTPIPKKGNAKECSNYHTVSLISQASKVMLKILQARLQQYVNHELPDDQAGGRLLLNHANTPGFLAPGGEEFNPVPEMRLDSSELLCSKVLLKCK